MDILLYSNIYILANSKINKKENKTFNNNGEIKSKKPKFQKINITSYVEIETKIKSDQLTCILFDIKDNNYTLQCHVNNYNTYYIIQNSISFLKDEILLINFDRDNDSKIKFEPEPDYNKTPSVPPEEDNKDHLGSSGALAIIIVIIVFGFLTG